jgi:crotonobetainyl-CoA:carnitine CoA-transferase CaiB-like acyl-CoA transferase
VIEALDEPHLSARDWFHNLSRPDIGAHMHNGFAWRFANAALPPVRPPPRLGEHSSGLLRSLLGLDDAAIDHLLAMEVTGSVI